MIYNYIIIYITKHYQWDTCLAAKKVKKTTFFLSEIYLSDNKLCDSWKIQKAVFLWKIFGWIMLFTVSNQPKYTECCWRPFWSSGLWSIKEGLTSESVGVGN